MGFLAPAFLLGLLALAVPVLIHLVHRERRETKPFPSLMFLKRVPHRSVRRRRIRQWLLLALRSAALAFLALAFAEPVLESAGRARALTGGAVARVVLVDRSYSMGYQDRWPRALQAARGVLGEARRGDRTALVFFGEAAHVAAPLTDDRAVLEAALGGAELGWGGTRFAPALTLGLRLLDESGLPKRELVLVSDFQSRALDGLDEVRLPAGTELRSVSLSQGATHNRGITEVTLQRVYEGGRERVAVAARIARQGEGSGGVVPVTLELGGLEADRRSVELADESAVTVRFDPIPFPAAAQQAVVRLAGDGLPQDDAFRFILAPGQDLGVLIVGRDGSRATENLFLRRALAIGDRPRFDVRERMRSAVRPQDLASVGVVLLNDAAWPDGEAGRALHAFVNRGGGVLAALGARSGGSGDTAGLVDRSADWGGTIAFLDYQHPALELFRRPRSGDFASARFLRYRMLRPPDDSAVLARFDDGNPALVETRLGDGRVLLWTSSLDTLWNDLPLQPVFLPFLHRLVAHAAGYAERPAWRQVGDVLELPALAAGRWVGLNPLAERALRGGDGRFVRLESAGFYELRPSGDEGAKAPLIVAVNADPSESDLKAADPEEVTGGLNHAGSAPLSAAAVAGDEPERSQDGWWFLLLAALAVLATETALSNRLSEAVR
ncbi:MAG: BatA domain-containing protein [Vicinamibacterales bacterium]